MARECEAERLQAQKEADAIQAEEAKMQKRLFRMSLIKLDQAVSAAPLIDSQTQG